MMEKNHIFNLTYGESLKMFTYSQTDWFSVGIWNSLDKFLKSLLQTINPNKFQQLSLWKTFEKCLAIK